MKKRILLAVLLLASCLTVGFARQTQTRQQWQYLQVPSLSDKSLNELGGEGWELVAVKDKVSGGSSLVTYYYLKRQK